MTFGKPPKADQIEISLFGPGFGECCLIHLGSGQWVVIDSCLHSDTGEPAALYYLRQISVEPADTIRLIIATHWHDDHIRGIARVFAAWPKADFCSAAAFTQVEFLATVLPYAQRGAIAGGPGVQEIFNVFEVLRRPDGTYGAITRAFPSTRVLTLPAHELAHGRDVRVTTLSPSNAQYEKFLAEITQLMPIVRETRRRAISQSPNKVSVVTLVEVGEVAILLGGDLEETGDPDTGWSVIVASTNRPPGKARIFKVPHHGSDNAHNQDVWSAMLEEDPYALLTPFNRGRTKRPARDDVARIAPLTPNAYITSGVEPPRAVRRSPMVEKTIRERVGKLRRSEPRTGCIRLRNGGSTAFDDLSIELIGPAMPLANLYAR